MSRGIGKMQSAVLRYLQQAGRESITLETMRWDLWDDAQGPQADKECIPDTNDMLSGSWNTSITRAVRRLAEDPGHKFTIVERKLTSTDDFLRHYPNKTLSARMRHLRNRLLPILLDDRNPNFRSLYSRTDNESYHLEQITNSHAKQKAAKLWQRSESELISLLTATEGKFQKSLFLLIAKGKELFSSEPLNVKGGFLDYADELQQSGVLPASSLHRLDEIRKLVFPKALEQHLNLKSKLYSLVNFGRRGSTSSLKSDSVDWLNKQRPNILKLLKDYEAPTELQEGYIGSLGMNIQPVVKCPELDNLIDASALFPFRFFERVAI